MNVYYYCENIQQEGLHYLKVSLPAIIPFPLSPPHQSNYFYHNKEWKKRELEISGEKLWPGLKACIEITFTKHREWQK